MSLDQAEFTKFANHSVYWWGDTTNADVDDVLATILAKHSHAIEKEAREKFGFTDEDFIHALKNAPIGLFATKEQWESVTKRFGLHLPFPYISQRELFIERHKNKPNFQNMLKKLDNDTAELVALIKN